MRRTTLKRRQILKALGAAMGAAAVGGGALLRSKKARAAGEGPYFLIVLPAFGGGAIIDSVLPIRESEASSPQTLDCFPDAEVVDIPGSPLRGVDATAQGIVGNQMFQIPLSPFIEKHKQDMMVTTLTATSVNHAIAQKRALSGGGAYQGRTLQECVALAYGPGFPVPNVNMASLGYLEPGADRTLPSYCYGEAIAEPLLWPVSLHAKKGTKDLPEQELVDMARTMRNEELDAPSSFYQTFRGSKRLALWDQQRGASLSTIEGNDLISKLLFVQEGPGVPLSEYGLSSSPDAAKLAAVFPDIGFDPLERQAALAYLLLKNRVSVTVTLAPAFAPVIGGPFQLKNPPLAFDGSHNNHRYSQAVMWFRVLSIADRLIDLLKQTVFDEDTGESFWSRTMIHFATDFGRSKQRPSGEIAWGTAHNLNNGHLTISPLVNGNTVLGGVWKGAGAKDGNTYGFNLVTGAPDTTRETSEAESFAGLLQALRVDLSATSLPDVPAMRRQG